ncbi:hypothetical protein RJ639_008969 [Escallonia herrerae]|uniref:DUF4219 domain-containing protein n=1 Tax=Escallonia herrerae TaxID=1293975 RepID=A0AA88VVF7_9ASTE|nr:hypothetical protein RJ639_008969 [Escallonia herrerae]
MSDLQVVGGIKKLNHQNYNTWETCMTSYMQGQDLWEVVNGSEVMQPEAEDANGTLRKWKIKAGKAMFALKTTIEEDVLEHIQGAKTPKEAWGTLAMLFSKKNDTRLQLLAKRAVVDNATGFVAAVQGWPNQPSLVEFENLLTSQEAMAKQMGGVSLKGEEEALYANKSRGNSKQHTTNGSKRNHDKEKGHQGEKSFHLGEASKNHGNNKKI